MRALIAIACISALCGVASGAPAQSHRCDAPNSCDRDGPLFADLDGDGSPDKVALITMPKLYALGVSKNVTVLSTLWGKSSSSNSTTDTMLMIVFGRSNRVFMLTDSGGYFNTPIWHSKDLPVSVAKRGSKAFKEFKSEEHRIENDIIVLGTEAGIDTALYWNGNTFALFEPAEEP